MAAFCLLRRAHPLHSMDVTVLFHSEEWGTMSDDAQLPVATLAYQTHDLTNGLWPAARLVGGLAFWVGVTRVLQSTVELLLALVGGMGIGWGGGTSVGQLAAMSLYLLGHFGGGFLLISGGRSLRQGRK